MCFKPRSALRYTLIGVVMIMLIVSQSRLTSASDASDVFLETERADTAVFSAYEAILDAERAGANITILINKLNDACQYQTIANSSLSWGYFHGALGNSTLAWESIDSVEQEASELTEIALVEADRRLWISIAGSSGAITLILILLYFGWKHHKRSLLRRGFDVETMDEENGS